MPESMAIARVPRRADAVVVGGGCMGTSIAFHLARRGVDVVLVERGHVASGATGHSGALVRQHYEARIGIRLARESLGFFQRFEKETGYPCDFRTTGFLSGTRHRDLAAFEALLSLLRSEGVKAERLTSSEAKGVEPQLNVSDYAAVVHDPEAGYADPITTAVGFARAAEARGAVVLEDRDVLSVITRSGRIAGVQVRGRSTIATERVILAAGNWTPELARPLPVQLPVRFVRGDIVILRRPSALGRLPKSTSTSTATRTPGRRARRTCWSATWTRIRGRRSAATCFRTTPSHRRRSATFVRGSCGASQSWPERNPAAGGPACTM